VVLGAQHAARLLPALMGLAPKGESQPEDENAESPPEILGHIEVRPCPSAAFSLGLWCPGIRVS
jgi:hypothetical protein